MEKTVSRKWSQVLVYTLLGCPPMLESICLHPLWIKLSAKNAFGSRFTFQAAPLDRATMLLHGAECGWVSQSVLPSNHYIALMSTRIWPISAQSAHAPSQEVHAQYSAAKEHRLLKIALISWFLSILSTWLPTSLIRELDFQGEELARREDTEGRCNLCRLDRTARSSSSLVSPLSFTSSPNWPLEIYPRYPQIRISMRMSRNRRGTTIQYNSYKSTPPTTTTNNHQFPCVSWIEMSTSRDHALRPAEVFCHRSKLLLPIFIIPLKTSSRLRFRPFLESQLDMLFMKVVLQKVVRR